MGDLAAPTAAGQEAAIKARVINHMNKDHAAELEHYLRAFNGIPASAAAGAQIVDMSLDAMTIKSASGTHKVGISPPLPNYGASRVKLVEMSRTALSKLGLSDIKIDAFAPPTGFDCVVLFGVAFYFFCAATRGLVQPGTAVWDLLNTIFPYGAVGYRWLVKAIFLPVLACHLVEAWWMFNTRLTKHRVEMGSKIWWLWVGTTFFGGVPAFMRFDRLVQKEKQRKEGLKH
ncbi:hypothetical protein BJ170DRAFT_488800 [Xylariales sp. AK1849]|nr:hypothetical protein BJ170DRAFT_488800 [Xylariales sp. AK1849]